jgi:hypothetical protein
VRNYDLEFLKRFSMVIGLLALVTLGLILLARHLHNRLPPEISPTAVRRTAERIHPAGAVYAGATGAAAQAAAAAAATAASISAVPPIATLPVTSPVAGLNTSPVVPAPGTSFPPR